MIMDCCRKNLFKTDPACEEALTRPRPCKIILPPKRRPGAFDDLRFLGFFTYVGNILTFLIAFFFVLSVLEYILNQQLQLDIGRSTIKLDTEPETGTQSSKKGSQESKREPEIVTGKASVNVMPEKESQYVPKESQEKVPGKVQDNVLPEKKPQHEPKGGQEKASDKVQVNSMPEKEPKKGQEKTPERDLENEPDNVPQKRPDKAPGNEPEKMSESVPKAGLGQKHGGRKAPCHTTHEYSEDASWFDLLFSGRNG